jgi:hypothetical protein
MSVTAASRDPLSTIGSLATPVSPPAMDGCDARMLLIAKGAPIRRPGDPSPARGWRNAITTLPLRPNLRRKPAHAKMDSAPFHHGFREVNRRPVGRT